MVGRIALLSTLVGLVVAACASPQPLPVAPTPIPTLVPATLPAMAMPKLPPVAAGAAVTGADAAAPTVGAQLIAPVSAAPSTAIGEGVWDMYCKACHRLTDEKMVGPGLAGVFERQPALAGGKPFSEENLIDWIRTGGGQMPAFSMLTDAELNGLIAFLKEAT